MFGSQTLHPWCHSILIFPLDQAIHPLVRCKNRNSIRLAAPGGGFSTAKSEITLSNGQIQVCKQRTCIVWITDTPSIVWKRAHHSLGSSNRLTCPLRNFGTCGIFNGKVWNYAINGQIEVYKQRACIAWVTGTPFVVSKRAHHSVGSSNSPTCPLQNS